MAHVLIVDDDDSVREGVDALVRSLGHTTALAVDGADAIGILEKEAPFDLIISDFNMPGMTGVAFLGLVRNSKDKVKARTPFILHAGATTASGAALCEDLGAVFVQKGGPGLEAAIQTILGT